jgi:hypothetical protein
MKDALEITLRTVERRAWLYRKTAAIIAISFVLVIASVAVFRSWLPLMALIPIVEVVAAFLVLDNRHVYHWRQSILHLCAEDRLNIASFTKLVCANPMIPQQTIHAMLASLPQAAEPNAVGRAEESRKALRSQETRTIVGSIGVTGVLLSFASLAFFPPRLPLIGFGLSLLIWWYVTKGRSGRLKERK